MNSEKLSLSLSDLIQKLSLDSQNVSFEEVMQVISDNYTYTAATFTNGDLVNEAGTNEGSCKIFAFAQINKLSEADTLSCFGQYYRDDVLKFPDAKDHGNIRNFMKTGWDKIDFNSVALAAKS